MLFLYLPFAALLDLAPGLQCCCLVPVPFPNCKRRLHPLQVMMFTAVVLLKWLIVGRVKPGGFDA